MKIFVFLCIFFSLIRFSSAAEEVSTYPFQELVAVRADGKTNIFTQGGLIKGRISPQALLKGGYIIFNDLKVIPHPTTGSFILGLHINAPSLTKIIWQPKQEQEEAIINEITVEQRQYDTQYIEGLPAKKVTPPAEVIARIKGEAERVWLAREHTTSRDKFFQQTTKTIWPLDQNFIWPVAGIITGEYGARRILNGIPKQPHYGIDIAAPEGTKVLAPADGFVRLVEPDLYYSGGTLLIDHGEGLMSGFLHLKAINVSLDDHVKKGQVIALVGSTGRSTGAHLDWRINWYQNRLDPALLVSPPS